MATNSIQYIYEAVDRFSRVADKINNKIKSNQKAMERLRQVSSKMKSIGKDLTRKMTLPLTALGGASIYAFANYEKGLINVGTLIGKTEFAKFKDLLDITSKSAIKQGFAIEDSNKALFDSLSALGDVNKSVEVFNQGQILAKAGVTSLGVSVNGLTSVMNAYSLETAEASKVSNAFFTAQKIGKTTVEELALNVGKVAPLAKNAGVGFEELLSTMSALTLGGLSTDEASTALRGALSGLVKPADSAAKILKQLGVPFGAVNIRAKGLAFTLNKLNEVSEKYPDLLAQAIPNVRAYIGISALQGDKLKKVDDALKMIADDYKNGTGLLEAYNMQTATASDKLARFWGNLKTVSIEIGVVLIPYLEKLMNWISKLANKFDALSPATKKFIVISVAILAILPPLMILIGFLGTAISTIGSVASAWIAASAVIIPAIVVVYGWVKKLIDKFGKLKDVFTSTLKNINPLNFLGNIFGKNELVTNTSNYQNFKPIDYNNSIQGDINVNIKAPKGTIEKTETKQKGSMLRLGTNLSEAY